LILAQDLLYLPNRDVYVDENGLSSASGLDEIKQTINNILATPLGTWLDTDVGLDYSWLIGGYDENAAKLAIETAVKQDKRITDVLEISPSYDNDNHRVDFYIRLSTTLGELDFHKEVNTNATN
jgi:hypothetical protein